MGNINWYTMSIHWFMLLKIALNTAPYYGYGFIQCCLQFVYFVFQSSKGLLISEHYGAQFFYCTKEINKYYWFTIKIQLNVLITYDWSLIIWFSKSVIDYTDKVEASISLSIRWFLTRVSIWGPSTTDVVCCLSWYSTSETLLSSNTVSCNAVLRLFVELGVNKSVKWSFKCTNGNN